MSIRLLKMHYAVVTQQTYIDDSVTKTIEQSYPSIESAMNDAINQYSQDELIALVSIDDDGNVESIYNREQLLHKIETLQRADEIEAAEEKAGMDDVNQWYWGQR